MALFALASTVDLFSISTLLWILHAFLVAFSSLPYLVRSIPNGRVRRPIWQSSPTHLNSCANAQKATEKRFKLVVFATCHSSAQAIATTPLVFRTRAHGSGVITGVTFHLFSKVCCSVDRGVLFCFLRGFRGLTGFCGFCRLCAVCGFGRSCDFLASRSCGFCLYSSLALAIWLHIHM